MFARIGTSTQNREVDTMAREKSKRPTASTVATADIAETEEQDVGWVPEDSQAMWDSDSENNNGDQHETATDALEDFQTISETTTTTTTNAPMSSETTTTTTNAPGNNAGALEDMGSSEMYRGVECDFASLRTASAGKQQLRSQQASTRNAVVLAVNHKAIACTEAGYAADSWCVTPMTVVRVEDPGFSKAPFAKNMDKKKMAEAKPVCVLEGDGELRMYSFKKAPMSKGDRVDALSFNIGSGDTFNTFMDLSKYKEMRRLDPEQQSLPEADPTKSETSIIPAFSLIEVTVAPKNSENAEFKGSLVNIVKVRRVPDDVTLHSVAGVLGRLPASLNDALLSVSAKALASPCVSKDLQRDKVAFFKKECATDTSVEVIDLMEEGVSSRFVRLGGWSNEACENINSVDVPEGVLLRMCNAKDVDHAVSLLSIAFAMKAVSLLVTNNAYTARGGASPLRGVPIVSVAKLLAVVKFDKSSLDRGTNASGSKVHLFETNCQYADGTDGTQEIQIGVNIEAVLEADDASSATGTARDVCPAQDFALLLPGYTSGKMYVCTASLKENKNPNNPKDGVPDVLRFSLDASKRSASASVLRGGKRKLTSMQWS